jgi:beta-phosphoglucomutase-like phosphatase (HAD superfamily)
MTLRGVLFDMDGVLVDSEGVGKEIAAAILRERGILFSQKYLARFVGIRDQDFYRMAARDNASLDPDEAHLAHSLLYGERLKDVQPFTSALQFLRRCVAEGLAVGVVTGSLRAQAEQILSRMGIRSLVEVVVAAEDVKKGKPDPEGYRRAVRALGLQEAQVVAIEDSDPGICAAKGAFLTVIAVSGGNAPSTTMTAVADRLVANLESVEPSDLQNNQICPTGPWEIGAEWPAIVGRLGRRICAVPSDPNASSPWSWLQTLPTNAIGLLLRGNEAPIGGIASWLGAKLVAELSRLGLLDLTPPYARFNHGLCVMSIRGTPIFVDRPLIGSAGKPQSSNVYLDDSSVRYVDAVERALGSHVPRSVLEIGTGTGLALVRTLRAGASQGFGVDIQAEAVHLSRLNAALNGVARKSLLLLGDLFDVLPRDQKFDLVLVHPPYRLVPPELDYPNPVQRLGVGELGIGQILTIMDRLPAFMSEGGRGLLYIQLPDGPSVSSLQKLMSSAANSGVKANWIPDTGASDDIDSVIDGIAEKFVDGASVRARTNVFLADLGITGFKSGVLALTR